MMTDIDLLERGCFKHSLFILIIIMKYLFILLFLFFTSCTTKPSKYAGLTFFEVYISTDGIELDSNEVDYIIEYGSGKLTIDSTTTIYFYDYIAE